MRHRGGGVGHKNTWHLNEVLMNDASTERNTDIGDVEEGSEDSEADEFVGNTEDELSEEQEPESEENSSVDSDVSQRGESNSEPESNDEGFDDL